MNALIPVYFICGLLDSGKTTFIHTTLLEQDWIKEGVTLLLQCEEGEYDLPESVKLEKRLTILPVKDPAQFTTAWCDEITAAFHPAQIIIEFNGMWDPKAFLQQDFSRQWGLAGIYSIADGSQLELVMNNMRNLFMNQHTQSDLIVVNRCRKDTKRVNFRKAIRLQNPAAQIIFESETGEIIEFGEDDLPYDVKAPAFSIEDDDYGTWFADASEYPDRYLRKKITFLCQSYRSFGMPRNVFVPGRRVMACCAADVQFYGFPCKADSPVSFKNNSWHLVTVEFTTEKRKDPRTGAPAKMPMLRLLSVEDAAAPEREVVTL